MRYNRISGHTYTPRKRLSLSKVPLEPEKGFNPPVQTREKKLHS